MVETTDFGLLSDDRTVDLIRLSTGELKMDVITYGAAIQNLTFRDRRMVLGLNSAADYENHSPHFGAIAGRVANRIADGRMEIAGKSYQLDINEGPNHLHGGKKGFGKRIWKIDDAGADWVRLVLKAADGEMGYPGNIDVSCLYRLSGNTVEITLSATTDAETLVNLATHSYFNLGGSHDILDHRLKVFSNAVTMNGEDLIPTGVVRGVAGTVYDFRDFRRVGGEEGSAPERYDINFVCQTGRQKDLFKAASVQNPETGVALDILTTEPGLQVYTGSKLDLQVPGLDGKVYGPFSGLCLEPQVFPDAIHHPHFPQANLLPGAVYEQKTHYVFSDL